MRWGWETGKDSLCYVSGAAGVALPAIPLLIVGVLGVKAYNWATSDGNSLDTNLNVPAQVQPFAGHVAHSSPHSGYRGPTRGPGRVGQSDDEATMKRLTSEFDAARRNYGRMQNDLQRWNSATAPNNVRGAITIADAVVDGVVAHNSNRSRRSENRSIGRAVKKGVRGGAQMVYTDAAGREVSIAGGNIDMLMNRINVGYDAASKDFSEDGDFDVPVPASLLTDLASMKNARLRLPPTGVRSSGWSYRR
jgi:hypothetical protein